jgi:hypothetical protein
VAQVVKNSKIASSLKMLKIIPFPVVPIIMLSQNLEDLLK